ncbi:T9SS type A sorting domain-containing protein [Flavobacterium tyrosinilyticum]|uniref:T9SS type A sorting domain-containing protein n=1 Tax=Flavobacterium tyrosinilyticum TaxID=1658740 RepID=UPI0020309F42|nr:T9SS type A sorting domain-containing protein [Flavobacterium tyrosinilyticum]MCM0664453.1 T9SS type A sorting domain-containing protein [Flavobacterium tyrosinilyticum]
MKLQIFTFLFFLLTTISHSQIPVAGELDTSFGDSGTLTLDEKMYLLPYSIKVQPKTGDILIAGCYEKTEGHFVGFIRKYDFYGNPKKDFGTNGFLEISDLVYKSYVLYRTYFESSDNDSRIYIRGARSNLDGSSVYFISRYLSNGTLDTSYGTNGSIDIHGQIHGNYIYSLLLNPITQHQTLNRYNLSDGSLDSSFNNGDLPFSNSEITLYRNQYDQINFQDDGKIILSGYEGQRGIIVCFDNTGHIDTGFGVNGFYRADPNYVKDIFFTKIQSDGKIIFLNRQFTTNNPATILGRLNKDGSLDTSYGDSGYFRHRLYGSIFFADIALQSDDKIIFCGSYNFENNDDNFLYTTRVSKEGKLDFWKNDLPSIYSENWSLALVKDSYLFSLGLKSPNVFEKNFPLIRKMFLKQPEISINGSSLPDNATDIVLPTTDGILYTIDNVVLSQGDIKFRLDKSDNLYWGKSESAPFLSGISTMGAETIKIDTPGTYKINFNIKTGAYSLINNTLGIEDFNNQKLKFVFYPNPSKEKITFNENLKSIKVYATDGKLINSNLVNNEINISSFPKGVYYFQVVTENDTIIGDKFIKE